MKRVPIVRESPHPDAIHQAVAVLRRGGVIVYPTDTCYGLGADARNRTAVRRLIEMKHRDSGAKPFSVIVKSVSDIPAIAKVDGSIERVLHRYLPGPFTFVLVNLDFRISRSSSVGVRIPNCATTGMLTSELGGPYTTTSANIAGLPSPYSYPEIEQSLLAPLKLQRRAGPDLVLDAGALPAREASTVVDLTTHPPRILRVGSGRFREPSVTVASVATVLQPNR